MMVESPKLVGDTTHMHDSYAGKLKVQMFCFVVMKVLVQNFSGYPLPNSQIDLYKLLPFLKSRVH